MPQKPAEIPSLIAAIDLGSNSFHMVVAKVHHGEIRILERLGDKVQLAAGLDEERNLSEEAMQRGLECLRRFAQMIAGLPEGARSADGRVIGTYLHGLFASDEFRRAFLGTAADATTRYEAGVEAALDGLAAHLEKHLDLDALLALAEEPKETRA